MMFFSGPTKNVGGVKFLSWNDSKKMVGSGHIRSNKSHFFGATVGGPKRLSPSETMATVWFRKTASIFGDIHHKPSYTQELSQLFDAISNIL